MHPAIAQHRQGIARICERYRISRLDVFGSAARGQDFQPERSDADFWVEFAPGSQPGLSVFMGVQSALAQLLGRQVDLIEAGSVRNPFVLQGINSSRETVYAA